MLLILMTAWGLTPARRDGDPDYPDRYVTTSVNGIFITAVFFVHLFQYREFTGIARSPMVALLSRFGHLVVVTFLFFSGYGLMRRVSAEGDRYIRSIPLRRVYAMVCLILSVLLGCLFQRLTDRLLSYFFMTHTPKS